MLCDVTLPLSAGIATASSKQSALRNAIVCLRVTQLLMLTTHTCTGSRPCAATATPPQPHAGAEHSARAARHSVAHGHGLPGHGGCTDGPEIGDAKASEADAECNTLELFANQRPRRRSCGGRPPPGLGANVRARALVNDFHSHLLCSAVVTAVVIAAQLRMRRGDRKLSSQSPILDVIRATT
jgi:hypothetical protein